MNPNESWATYIKRIQEYLDSDECNLCDLVVVPHGRILRLTRYGAWEESDVALQCLQAGVEFAELSWYEPGDDWEIEDSDNRP